MSEPPTPPSAIVTRRRGVSAIWLLPIVAAAIGGYLAFTTLSRRGPEIVLTFLSADGLTAGQTKVKHKAVDLGTVEGIQLASDMSHVIVHVRMQAEAEPYLTGNARFWAVRPRLSGSNISGLETLISGGYIELDPGERGKDSQREFTGLENPPGRRSDEPGTTFALEAARIGSLGSGSPVFYRDIVVGEVLGYALPEGNGPITVNIFVRAPYDKWVRMGSHFWDASGVRIELGSSGVHVQLESLQAVLSGGVSFSTPEDSRDTPSAPGDTSYKLFASETDADAASYTQRLPFVMYFQSSAAGLGVGAPVQLYGIQIGNVTGVSLQFDPAQASARVRVAIEVQPERLTSLNGNKADTPEIVASRLIDRGMRASLTTVSYLTGALAVSLDFPANPAPAKMQREGDLIVLPTLPGGLSGLTSALSDVAQKVNAIPFLQLGNNANALLATVNALLGGPEIKQAVGSIATTMNDVQGLVKHADAGLSPLLKRLPDMSADLQQALSRVDHLVGSADLSYGNNSQFQRDLERLMAQFNDMARSIRLLADFLDRHPEALIRGRTALGIGEVKQAATRRAVLLAPLALAVTRCASPDPAVYTLRAVPGVAQPGGPPAIKLTRPGLAGYLDRPEIVRDSSANRLVLRSGERWGEPLGDMIGRVLAEDLSQRLPGSSVFTEAGSISVDPSATIELDIQRFDLDASGTVVFQVQVAVELGRSHDPVGTRSLRLTLPPASASTTNLVATMSALLGQLADALAGLVLALPPDPALVRRRA